MSIVTKNWRPCFLCVVALLVCYSNLSAQPSGCSANFDVLRSCDSHFISAEFVFIGRVVATDEKLTRNDSGDDGFWGVRVEVEEAIKGKPGSGVTELFLSIQCRGPIEMGQKYVFIADRAKVAGLDRLVSRLWSSTLRDVQADELKKSLGKIRSVIKGKKQPSIVGKVVEYDSSQPGLAGFMGLYLSSKLGYDPRYSFPVKGVEVIAKPVEENSSLAKKISYATRTNSEGNYEFRDLPKGFYELYLTVPDAKAVHAFIYEPPYYKVLDREPFHLRGKKAGVTIDDGICSADVRFNVRPKEPAGKINGKLIFESGLPAEEPFLRLLFVESESERSDSNWAAGYSSFNLSKSKSDPDNTLEFQYSDLLVGKYILKIVFDFKDPQKNFYYPGVREIKDAEIIEIRAGETKNLSMKFN